MATVITNGKQTVKLYQSVNRGRAMYQLAYYNGGRRVQQNFADKAEAKRVAKQVLGGLAGDATLVDAAGTPEMESLVAAKKGLTPGYDPHHLYRTGIRFPRTTLPKVSRETAIQPSKKNTLNFLEKVRATIQRNKTATQENLIWTLNPIIRGWVNYHRFIAAKKTFKKVDEAIWRCLWRWAMRRHPGKSRRWVLRRYWRPWRQNSWRFAMLTKQWQPDGKPVLLQLVSPNLTKIEHYWKIKGEANPFDPQWKPYFEDRLFLKKFGIHRYEIEAKPSC